MKKSIIALAVAGALAAPMVAQADATLYGSFRIGLASTDGADGNPAAEDKNLDVEDQSSRIGIKGDIDLGLQDTKGLFHWEANINTADSDAYGEMFGKRVAYIGAKGDWGMATVGRQYHPHYLLINSPINVFNPSAKGYGERFNLAARVANTGGVDHKRVDNTVAYTSPTMGGFKFIVAGVFDGGDDVAKEEQVDGYNVAATYNLNGLTVSGSVAGAKSDLGEESDTWGVAVTYKINAVKLAASYEDVEIDGVTAADDEEHDAWHFAATYTVGSTSFYGRYADYDGETSIAEMDYKQWGLGIQQKLGNGRVFLEHINNDSEDTEFGDKTQVGYRVDF